MKKLIILATVIFSFCLNGNLNAQALRIEKEGVVLTKDDNSDEYFLENITTDTLNVVVQNHQKKFEDLGDGIIAVSDGEHATVEFKIPPKTKMSLDFIVCRHSTGLLISDSGKKSNLLEYKFY